MRPKKKQKPRGSTVKAVLENVVSILEARVKAKEVVAKFQAAREESFTEFKALFEADDNPERKKQRAGTPLEEDDGCELVDATPFLCKK